MVGGALSVRSIKIPKIRWDLDDSAFMAVDPTTRLLSATVTKSSKASADVNSFSTAPVMTTMFLAFFWTFNVGAWFCACSFFQSFVSAFLKWRTLSQGGKAHGCRNVPEEVL